MHTCPTCHNQYPKRFKFCPVDDTPLTPTAADPLLGVLLRDVYRVEERLGEGGMAQVYLAIHDRLGRKFAVKVLKPAYVSDQTALERFFRDARTAASLNHPHIVEAFDYGETPDGSPFIVMELLLGEDLGKILQQEGRLEIERTIRIAGETANALEAVHAEEVIHRDIKPSNIVIRKTHTDEEQVKIVDFGIALLRQSSRLTAHGYAVGTPLYMSPEQARGALPEIRIDHRSDLYSLGATIFHCCCGRPPFEGEMYAALIVQHIAEPPPKPRTLRPDLPPPLEELILSLLEKDPKNRPQSAEEVRRALESMTAQPSATAPTERFESFPSTIVFEEIRVVTVLVAELGTPRGGEKEDVRQTAEVFELLAQEVGRQAGEVDYLAGNRAVGLFGLTHSFGDEPIRAVRAATAALNRIKQRDIVKIAVGTGRAVVPTDNVATGPAAAAADRLLARVGSGKIAVDATTFSGIRGVFRGHPLPARPDEPPAFEVVKSIDGVHPSRKSIGAPTIGRDDELDQLWEAFTHVIDAQRPTLVTVTGEAGLGKSRLKDDFFLRIDSLAEMEVEYLEGAGQILGDQQPFSGLADLIRRRARLEADCSEEKARSQISELVSQVGVDRDPGAAAWLLALMVGQRAPRSPSLAGLSPQRLRERMIHAFVRLIRSMSRVRPVVMCLEDAHRLDRATIDALAQLCTASPGHAILLLVVGRPEMWDKLGDLPQPAGATIHLALEPLSRSETRALLAGLLRSDPPRPLQDAVWERTNGVPLFIEEIHFALRQQGAILPDRASGGWRFSEGAVLTGMPSTVEGVLRAQLHALAPELRQALRLAAVVGTVFWDDALAALGLSGCPSLLSALAGRELIVTSPTSSVSGCQQYEFRSTMMRDVAYQSIPEPERVSLHSEAADWLKHHRAAPAVVACHLEAAARASEAASEYVRAGDRATSGYANDEALRHYDSAIRLLSEEGTQETALPTETYQTYLDALFGKEQVFERLGRRDEALHMLDSISQLASALSDRKSRARAAVRRGALTKQWDTREAVNILGEALETCVEAGDEELRCDALCQLAQAAAFSGDLERSAGAAREAVEVARRLGSDFQLLRALQVQGTVTAIGLGPWPALKPLDQALDLARRTNNIEYEADILLRSGFLRSELGDLEAAEQALATARQLCERTSNQRVLAFALHNLGWVLWKRGRAREAREIEVEALEVSRQAKLHQVALESEVYLALFDIGEARPAEALDRARQVGQEASDAGHIEPQMHAAMTEALALLELSRAAEAAERAMEAVDLYNSLGSTQQFQVELHLVAAACLTAAGRTQDADHARELAAAALDRRQNPITDPEAIVRLHNRIGDGLPRVIRETMTNTRSA